MPKIKWTFELLFNLFAQRGYVLLSKTYTGAQTKYDYQCKCGNSPCSITIGNLKAGTDNCRSCAAFKRKPYQFASGKEIDKATKRLH